MIVREHAWAIWSPVIGIYIGTVCRTRRDAIKSYRDFWSEPMTWRQYRQQEGLRAVRLTLTGRAT